MSNNNKIIYFGTSDFAATILEKVLIEYPIDIVVTQPDRPSGRKQKLAETPVKEVANKQNLTILQPKNLKDEDFLNKLKSSKANLGILASYAQLVPKEIIDMFPLGILNVHPSLLPKYRGASPIQHAIMNLDKITGVTIIKLVEKLDAGPIVAQKEYPIANDDTNISLHDKLAEVGADLLLEVLPHYIDGTAQIIEQDESKMTMTKELERNAGHIDWNKTAEDLYAQFRALQPWPGVFTYFDKKRLKIADMSLYLGKLDNNFSQGQVFFGENKEISVKCSQGSIHIKKMQMEGKQICSTDQFCRGYNVIGKKLG